MPKRFRNPKLRAQSGFYRGDSSALFARMQWEAALEGVKVLKRQSYPPVEYRHRLPVDQDELQGLFESSWPDGRKEGYGSVLERSFTWVTAHAGSQLVGFVNIAWDGGIHYFLLYTTVHPAWRQRGIGKTLVKEAVTHCRGYVHVDADDQLMERLYGPCGFRAVLAGILATVGDR